MFIISQQVLPLILEGGCLFAGYLLWLEREAALRGKVGSQDRVAAETTKAKHVSDALVLERSLVLQDWFYSHG